MGRGRRLSFSRGYRRFKTKKDGLSGTPRPLVVRLIIFKVDVTGLGLVGAGPWGINELVMTH